MENDLTAAQVRAARALLAWSQQDLAKQANVAVSTIADFERGQRTPVANNVQAIKKALEAAGITFLNGGAVTGNVPMPKLQPKKSGMPISWINSTDLAQWADRRDSQEKLPQLIARLIRVSAGFSAKIDFPSGDAVQLGGWDGQCETGDAHTYVPAGKSGWELGTQRSKISAKATDDYEKRTAATPASERKKTTFIFVTPRAWTKKAAWLKAKRAEKKWKTVEVYAATDLLHWMEAYPAVGLWLSVIVGKRPAGILPLQEAWEEWSLATRPPLTPEITLAGRDAQAAKVLTWLRQEPSVLSMQGHSVEEAVAFLYASIAELPPEYRAPYEAMAIVANSADAARQLGDSLTPLIIVLDDAHHGLANKLVAKGHYVFLACSPSDDPHDGVTVLSQANRFAIEDALKNMGVKEPDAVRIAHDSAGSIAILRRLLPAGSIAGLPAWSSSPSKSLLAAMLAGAWDEKHDKDRTLLESLAQKTYEQIISDLSSLIGSLDSPVTKVGSIWKITSPRDAWLLLKRHLTEADFTRFSASATQALSPDEKESKDEDEYSDSSKSGYSKTIRNGLSESMVLFALYGNDIVTIRSPEIRIAHLIEELLKDASQSQWIAVHQQFQVLAEAAPGAFLQALEDDLNEDTPNIAVLFGGDDSGIFPTEKISTLLWSLESLAWSRKYLSDAVLVLAKLAAIDPGGRLQNRPANSLRQIFLLWHPQTYASMNERLLVIDKLVRLVPEVAWNLMLSIVPKDHDSASNSPLPRWRDYTEKNQETITYGLIWEGAEALLKRLLQNVGSNPQRWKGLLEVTYQFNPEQRERIWKALQNVKLELKDNDTDYIIWDRLRHLIHRHREHPGTGWSLPAEEVDKLETIYRALAPDNNSKQFQWLFSSNPEMIDPTPFDSNNDGSKPHSWDIDGKRLEVLRREAVKSIFNASGISVLKDFAQSVEQPFYVGVALGELDGHESEKISLVADALKSDVRSLHQMASGVIRLNANNSGTMVTELVSMAREEKWNNDVIVRIFTPLKHERATWKLVEDLGADVSKLYWQTASISWMEDGDDLIFALEHLLEAGRASTAIHLVGVKRIEDIPSTLLVSLLESAAQKSSAGDNDSMKQYYVIEIFKKLDKSADIADDVMARLEWQYLPMFRFSERKPLFLEKFLATNPEFFVEVLSALYKRAEGQDENQDNQLTKEQMQNLATRAWELFSIWSRVPGLNDDGLIDANALNEWVQKARQLSKEADRLDVADLQIGTIFASSPADAQGLWPAEAVRNVIEDVRSKHISRGFVTAVQNNRGVTSRGMLDGGQQERELARKYRAIAEEAELKWPRTSAMLESLARMYEEEARWHDEDAARHTW